MKERYLDLNNKLPERRTGKDRRAFFSYVEPQHDRRSGFDRRYVFKPKKLTKKEKMKIEAENKRKKDRINMMLSIIFGLTSIAIALNLVYKLWIDVILLW